MGSLFRKPKSPVPSWSIPGGNDEGKLLAVIAALDQQGLHEVEAVIRQIEAEVESDRERWQVLARRLRDDPWSCASVGRAYQEQFSGVPNSEIGNTGLQWTSMDSARCPYCGKRYPCTTKEFGMEFVSHISTESDNWSRTTRSKYRCIACKKEVGVIREKLF